ncbi:MAG: NAD(P)/FAD-dependent oxidoreductase [Candidatus Heimdallarchaeota archaeon]|nr:NAD(P)/FAD-dependent oxidoreductase [Candidatus Heimdallarchaeota archaeon]
MSSKIDHILNVNELTSDIAIIGAGPAGLLAGYETNPSKNGLITSVFTKSSKIGFPAHCSGLVSYSGLESLGLNMHDIKSRIGYNNIRRAKFVSPSNHSFEIDRGSKSMIVIDRPSLDQYLAVRTKKVGASVQINQQITQIKYIEGLWHLFVRNNGKNFEHRTKILINGEGVHARLARSINLPVPNPSWHMPSYQCDLSHVSDLESDCSELYFGQNYVPGFFGWVIPLKDESARVGVAVGSWMKGKTRYFFNKFLRKHPGLKTRFRKAHIDKSYGGMVPASGPISKTFNTNYMVIGDAAGQTKATTGGGVNIGGFCGRLAGKYAKQIVTSEISSKIGCKKYQQQWKAHFEPDLSLMKFFRRTISHLPDKSLDDLFRIAKDIDLNKSLETGSIDLHGVGLLRYALKPNVLLRGAKITPQLMVSFLKGFLV